MPLIYYLSSATAWAVDSCVRAIGGLVPPICHHLCSRTSPAGPARRFAITFARATCDFFYFFLLKNWPSLTAKNRRNGMENTPITIARTFWVFCNSYKLIKESGQSLQISAFRTADRKMEFFHFFEKWPILMAKNRRNGMENTPIKLARTFWVFCMSYKLIKESVQSLQISAFRIGDRKTEISKFVDFTLFWCLGLTIFEAWASTSPGGWASKSTGAWASKIVIWKNTIFPI